MANPLRAWTGSTLQKISRSVRRAFTAPKSADSSSYKQTWDSLAESYADAKRFVAGYEDEAQFELTARHTVDILEKYAGIKSSDVALEIGCGVGRVGKVLSKRVTTWIGTDISRNMLAYAAERLKGLDNCELKELGTVGLKEISDQSVDLVYCTVVFMHLHEWDRYKYVAEAHRVLKPGGRLYCDNVDITSSLGWKMFADAATYPPKERPSYLPMLSSADELRVYGTKAGFASVRIEQFDDSWLALIARKAPA